LTAVPWSCGNPMSRPPQVRQGGALLPFLGDSSATGMAGPRYGEGRLVYQVKGRVACGWTCRACGWRQQCAEAHDPLGRTGPVREWPPATRGCSPLLRSHHPSPSGLPVAALLMWVGRNGRLHHSQCECLRLRGAVSGDGGWGRRDELLTTRVCRGMGERRMRVRRGGAVRQSR
jgi:hypothetical protein